MSNIKTVFWTAEDVNSQWNTAGEWWIVLMNELVAEQAGPFHNKNLNRFPFKENIPTGVT